MAAPQRHLRYPAPAPPAPRPIRDGVRKRATAAERRKAAGRRRRFVVLVVVPAALMLGSIYTHTVAASLEDRVVTLEKAVAQAGTEGARLEVRVAELSSAERIRDAASRESGLRDPSAADLRNYQGQNREDGREDGSRKKGEADR